MPDFTIDDHGSIVLLHPVTDQARAWVADNLPAQPVSFAGALAIERRFIEPILWGIHQDDLTWGSPVPTMH